MLFFIKFIKSNNLASKEKLNLLNIAIKNSNYYGMQYILAEIIQNFNCTISLKSICKISSDDIKLTATSPVKQSDGLIFTEDSNIYLYVANNGVYKYDVTIDDNKIVSKIFDLNYLDDTIGSGVDLAIQSFYTCGQTIVLRVSSTYCFWDDSKEVATTIFLQEINGEYHNITPEDHNQVENVFIGVQKDKQGNNNFILLRKGRVVSYTIENDQAEIKVKNLTKKGFIVEGIETSKQNDLMIIYGANSNNNKLELQTY